MNKKTPVYIVAELSANHGNSLDTALQTVRASAWAGANAIKVQTFDASTLTLPSNLPGFGPRDYGTWKGFSSWDLYSQAAMPYEWHLPIMELASELGIDFFSTAFDMEGVDFLEKLNVSKYKISSFEITDIPLIEKIAKTGKPVFISTGLANFADIQSCVETIRSFGNEQITLLKCTSEYPASIDHMNLLGIGELKKHFNVEVGLSDHSKSLIIPAIAVGAGARVIERHIILNEEIESVDRVFSTTPEDFKVMVQNVREAELALGHADFYLSEADSKRRKHIFAIKDIHQGEHFDLQNIKSLRSAGFLEPKHLNTILGKRALSFIKKGTPIDVHNYNEL